MLFVEDNQDDVDLIGGRLKREWPEAIWRVVQTGPALELVIKDEVFDIVLCDVRMPVFTPTEALHILRSSKQYDIPFVVLSGSVEEDINIDVMQQGANDLVLKGEKNYSRLILTIKRELLAAERRLQNRILQETNSDMFMEAIGVFVDMRDQETQDHTLRVTDLTMRLAMKFGISGDDLKNIHRGCLLHDMGKIGIPDNILKKPGSLTTEERKVMEEHPALAYHRFKHIPLLKDVLVIPYCHHEKWDGSGYPRGLMGEEIPLAARIFAVVDVWDAVTNDRPYRKAWDKERALQHIRLEKSISFDPKIVDQFISMMESR